MRFLATREDIFKFVEHCKKMSPKFELVDGKKNSYLMNVIDGLIWPFNPKFLDDYITTIIGKVYFPDGMMYRDPISTLEIGSHEFIHSDDARRLTPPLFALLYLSPQILAIITMALYGSLVSWVGFLPFVALAIHLAVTATTFKVRRFTGFPLLSLAIVGSIVLSAVLVGLQALWMVVAIVPMAPIPSPGRAWAEFRGYGMSIHFEIWLDGRTNLIRKLKQFTTALYYFMWPFADAVMKRLKRYEERARAGDVTDPAYLHVMEFMNGLKPKQ